MFCFGDNILPGQTSCDNFTFLIFQQKENLYSRWLMKLSNGCLTPMVSSNYMADYFFAVLQLKYLLSQLLDVEISFEQLD
jgi:hypothetical protein